MKIDILSPPPEDIFRDRPKYTLIFISLLGLACFGLLLGVYAIVAETAYYDKLETLALGFFVGAALFLFDVGEKLQAYKKLTPPELEELVDLCRQHPEIKLYCELLTKAGRQPIRAEHEACLLWAEEENHRKSKQPREPSSPS